MKIAASLPITVLNISEAAALYVFSFIFHYLIVIKFKTLIFVFQTNLCVNFVDKETFIYKS